MPLAVLANEYGTKNPILPKTARSLAIPILDGLYPDGTPKRLGPESWRSLGTFVYKSRKTGHSYIAYKPTGGKLKIVYLLVDHVKGLKEMRRIRNMYDAKLPELYALITDILQDAITEVYNQQFIDALNSIGPDLVMKRIPSVIPSADLHGERLTPKY